MVTASAGPPRVLGIPLLVALRHCASWLLCLIQFGAPPVPTTCLVTCLVPAQLEPHRFVRGSVGPVVLGRGAHIGICLDPVVPPTPVVVFTSAFTHLITVHSDSLMRELFDEKLV
jgi:hypothetical protein